MKPNRRISSPPPACLLCGHDSISIVDSVRTEELTIAWRQFGVTFSPEAWAVFEGTSQVFRYGCDRCGFEFFDPALAGRGSFYAELQTQLETYYPVTCPGFERAIKFALRHKLRSVLDVGCGSGSFLDLAKQAGLSTTGIELNHRAVDICRQKGHRVHSCRLADLEREIGPERFDLITIFEVLEHVADPVQLYSEAASKLAPFGCLAITVPNRNGVHRLFEMNPHLWPPHHLSWWRRRDLKEIARPSHLELVEVGGDLLLGAQIEQFAKFQNEILSALRNQRPPRRSMLLHLLVLIYRKSGCKFYFPRLGTSIYAFYRNPT
jgi:SAM-dependent methyltransferase